MDLILALSIVSDMLQVKNTVLNKEQLELLQEAKKDTVLLKQVLENQNKILELLEDLKNGKSS